MTTENDVMDNDSVVEEEKTEAEPPECKVLDEELERIAIASKAINAEIEAEEPSELPTVVFSKSSPRLKEIINKDTSNTLPLSSKNKTHAIKLNTLTFVHDVVINGENFKSTGKISFSFFIDDREVLENLYPKTITLKYTK